MFSAQCFVMRVRRLLVVAALALLCRDAVAADLLLTDGAVFPGQVWQSRNGAAEQSIFRREATANLAFPRGAMKIGPVAVGSDGKIYFASGLDGYVMHLLDRRNEVVSFEFGGQVRDIDCGGEPHTVYFSVVPTPQNGEPLADGKIYRRDLWAGQPSEFATIRQSDIGGNWWGTFAIRDGVIYLATFESPSRFFKWTSSGAERVFENNTARVQGFATGDSGAFYFTDGTDHVYRTADFQNVETSFRGARNFTDVAVEPAQIVAP